MYKKCEEILNNLESKGKIRKLNFEFPLKQKLKLKLKDMLEDEVDEKYYLSNAMLNYCLGVNQKESKFPRKERFLSNINRKNQDIAPTQSTYCNSYTSSASVLIKNKRLNSLVEKTNFEEGKVLNLDLYNQTTNENISQCLTEPHHNSQRLYDGLRIRKLTPKECWRLMGFTDEEFEKAKQVNSDTQLYKQASNSIVVNVLMEIFKNLFHE